MKTILLLITLSLSLQGCEERKTESQAITAEYIDSTMLELPVEKDDSVPANLERIMISHARFDSLNELYHKEREHLIIATMRVQFAIEQANVGKAKFYLVKSESIQKRVDELYAYMETTREKALSTK